MLCSRICLFRRSRRIKFAVPILTLFLTSVTLYLFCSIIPVILSDKSTAAAKIRDDEEVRFAQVLTTLNNWRRSRRFSPFSYSDLSTLTSKWRPYDRIVPPPGVTFAVLVPNRIEYNIDSYETSYIGETIVSLFQSIEHDVLEFGNRYRFINITLCPTTDDVNNFSDLVFLQSFVPQDAVKPRSRHLNQTPLNCRAVYDTANCLLQSVPLFHKQNFVVLLDDDMVPNYRALDQLWKSMSQFQLSHNAGLIPGLLHLYSSPNDLHYSLFDFRSLVELLLLSSFATLVLFVTCFKLWLHPFYVCHNLLFIFCTLMCNALFVISIGRAKWLSVLNRLANVQYVFPSKESSTLPTGRAFIIPSDIVSSLANFLLTYSCEELSQPNAPSKSQLIQHYLRTHNFGIWVTVPNLFKHRGLYSVFQHDILDPALVE